MTATLHIEELVGDNYSGDGIADGSTSHGLADAIAMIADFGRDGRFRVIDGAGLAVWHGSRDDANALAEHPTT